MYMSSAKYYFGGGITAIKKFLRVKKGDGKKEKIASKMW